MADGVIAAMRSGKHTLLHCLVLVAALGLAGCQSTPTRPTPTPPAAIDRDGPEASPPPVRELLAVPDPVPRLEPQRTGGPNKPYEIDGIRYVPRLDDEPGVERGIATWYGRKFHGRPTSNGEVYNMYAMTAAHKTLPLPSYARVRNPANGREVIVRINDRGPFVKGRIIDLSYTAALKLDLLRAAGPVEVRRITQAEIRAGLVTPPADAPPLYAPAEAAAAPPRTTTQDLEARPVPMPPPAEVVPLTPALAPASAPVPVVTGRFWAQLGAFRQPEGAETLRRQLIAQDAAREGRLVVVREGALHKLLAGPFETRDAARQAWPAGVVVERAAPSN
jgi:rare lipoprotein A